MTEKEKNLLVVFEERVHDLTALCNERKWHIEELERSLHEKETEVQQAKQTIAALQARYTHLLTAYRLAENEEEFQKARKRMNKLVREVDACIALLIE